MPNPDEARNEAWHEWWELVVGDDEPGEDTHDPHFNFMGGWDARGQHDAQQIAALRTALVAFISVCSHQDDAYHYDCLKPARWRTGDPDGCEWSACDEHAETWNPSMGEPWDEDKRVSNAMRALAGQSEEVKP